MPLTLFASLGTAYRFLWNERRDLFAYAFLPVLLVSFVQIAGLWATGATGSFILNHRCRRFPPNRAHHRSRSTSTTSTRPT
ncbi:MAG: hypothetical protein HOG93_04090 [Rhodospirillaceae bacterium]|jgi:hypothetical protein|nr:hypothetical protein [Rhodospirillaceae bacterium]